MSGYTQQIIVRVIPHYTLNPNQRVSRLHKQPWYTRLRDSAWGDAKNQGFKPIHGWVEAKVCVCWIAAKQRVHDDDNLRAMLKGFYDGLTNAGVWDDDELLIVTEVQQHVMEKHQRAFYPEGCIVIAFREVDPPPLVVCPIDEAGNPSQLWLTGLWP